MARVKLRVILVVLSCLSFLSVSVAGYVYFRSLQDSATTFKTWSGLANGGSSLMALTALVRTFTMGG